MSAKQQKKNKNQMRITNYNGRWIDAEKMNDFLLYADAAAAVAKHEEFERLVHGATFLSRDEYKSTSRQLPCYAQKCPARCLTSHEIFTLRCFSSILPVCLGICRCRPMSVADVCRRVLSNEASRVKSASTHRFAVKSACPGGTRTRSNTEKNALSRNLPWRIRDGRRDHYRGCCWFSRPR